VHRNLRPPARPVPPPAPRIIRNTVYQTVVHLHQTTHPHIQNRLPAAGNGRGGLLVLRQAVPPPEPAGLDGSRPALTARRMLRILSAESARQTLRPFFRERLRELLVRERETYRGRPAQSLALLQGVLGRGLLRETLCRLCRRTVEARDSAVLCSLVHPGLFQLLRWGGEAGLGRYARRELAVPEELRRLSAARRLPPLPPPAQEPALASREEPKEPPPSAAGYPLSGSGFQALVRGVADALGRQSRLESLRRGGV